MSLRQNNYYQHSFEKLSLTNKDVQDKEFEECSFVKCSFVDNQLKDCKFIDCQFTGCILSAVKPVNSRFINVSFKDSKAIGIDWTLAEEIRGLVFEKCQTSYSNFKESRFFLAGSVILAG